MTTMPLPTLTARGQSLDTQPDAFGFLRDSADIVGDVDALRGRFLADGYLYLPGLLDRAEVREARRSVLERAREEGLLDPDSPAEDGLLKPGVNPYFRPEYTRDNPCLRRILYEGPMMAFFARFLGGEVRHFDYTWLRAVGPGPGTAPHCDIVYMGRGTRNLFTAWTPLGDIPLTVGGLMILENSHRRTDLTGAYLEQDVDSYCENGPNAEAVRDGKLYWEHWQRWQEPGAGWDGAFSHDPPELRTQFGGRWLTSGEYRMGDVLIFGMATLHASIDNTTNILRLSTDTRYQRADEPVDERWIGDRPIAHGIAGKKGRIC
ncbi:MAG: phytanoyl-CoA dioxygenase family protein [Capsulimonadales bacterium]|nr:phytanoyl-CoA dioxygenase family protein [Capsulimonadales bacterium]